MQAIFDYLVVLLDDDLDRMAIHTCTKAQPTVCYSMEELTLLDHSPAERPQIICGDARKISLPAHSVDLVVTSPPYWRRRDYGHTKQLGQELTPEAYIRALVRTVNSWIPFLKDSGSIFLNIGDSYQDGFLVGIPARFEVAIRKAGWHVANHIVWAKSNGTPQPGTRRLANRHEAVFHLTRSKGYYFDMLGLMEAMEKRANPGDVWQPHHARNSSDHIAPFPPDLAKWALAVGCPKRVCSKCGKPISRIVEPSYDLDPARPQAQRAIALFNEKGLTEDHLKAIRAVGISDAGKGKVVQTGAKGNSSQTRVLAEEAKEALGGYFREFTFGMKRHAGWHRCSCQAATRPGMVIDPFMGTGTTLKAAYELELNSIGVDLNPPTTL